MHHRGSLNGVGTLRRWEMGGSIGGAQARRSAMQMCDKGDADVKFEAVYLFPNISPCSYSDRRAARPSLRDGTIGRCRESQRSKPRLEAI
jgi:hypothetical protein